MSQHASNWQADQLAHRSLRTPRARLRTPERHSAASYRAQRPCAAKRPPDHQHLQKASQAAINADSNGTNVLNNNDYIISAQVDSVGAQLQTVINGFEVLISGIGGSNSRDPYNDALKAVASGLDAAANSGNKLDLTEWQDVQTILNNSSILNN